MAKIITWNVNGIRACAKKGFHDFVDREDPDILCLQETKAHPDQLDENLIHPFKRKSHWSSATKKGYSGTVTYVKKNSPTASFGFGIKKFDSEGRFVITHHKHFDLYNIYFPNGAAREERHLFKQEFLKKLNRHFKKKLKEGRELIVVGDYNVAHSEIDVHDPVRLSKVSGFLPEEREWFDSFVELGMVDVFRHFFPTKKHSYTWWSYRENARIANRGWRIDYISVSQGLLKKIKSIEILDQQEGSDHCPVSMDINLSVI